MRQMYIADILNMIISFGFLNFNQCIYENVVFCNFDFNKNSILYELRLLLQFGPQNYIFLEYIKHAVRIIKSVYFYDYFHPNLKFFVNWIISIKTNTKYIYIYIYINYVV